MHLKTVGRNSSLHLFNGCFFQYSFFAAICFVFCFVFFSPSNQKLREAEIYDQILYYTVCGELMLVTLQDPVVGVVLTESYIVILIPACC